MVTCDCQWQFIKIPKIKVVCVLNWHFEIRRGLPSFYHASHQRIDSFEGLNWNFLMVVNLLIIHLINLMIRKLKRYKLQGQI